MERKSNSVSTTSGTTAIVLVVCMIAAGAAITAWGQGPEDPAGMLPEELRHPVGNAADGKEVFQFETFGNEGFWTDALQLPQGLAAAEITPLMALQLGLSVNSDALNEATLQALGDALQQVNDGTAPEDTAFGDPAVTLSLINQNAVIGVVTFGPDGQRKAQGNTGSLDLAAGDKVGLTCAVCHAITDNSVLPPTPGLEIRGSVGSIVDGPAPHGLDVGTILAAASNSRAYFPMLQLQFEALGGASIGRGDFAGLVTTMETTPTEEEVDEYLTGTAEGGERFYPVGQFDAFPDGIGNPVHITPFFRTDLSAPWGIDGGVAMLQDFNNTVFTVSLDPTSLLTPAGKQFLNVIAGPVGDEIAEDYERVLRASGVIEEGQDATDVVPFVEAEDGLTAGQPGSVVGRRVDEQKLLDLNAYLDGLPAPAPPEFDAASAERGRELFSTASNAGGANCASCHRADPNLFVSPDIIPMEAIYPGYMPAVIFDRNEPLSDIQNSEGPSPFFDDRMIVIDASRRGGVRGTALPLLLDLARKTSFLHDDSVSADTYEDAIDLLLNPVRGEMAAHAVFVESAADRADIGEYLKSRSTTAPELTEGGVVSAASFSGESVSPGQIVSIFGSGLGRPGEQAGMMLNDAGLVVNSLNNTQVLFDGTPAVLIFVSENQINAVVPFDVAGKSEVRVEVVRGGQTSLALTVPVAPTSPSLFTLDFSGMGQGAILNQDASINSSSNPAEEGSIVVLFVTGVGETNPPGVDGQPNTAPFPEPAAMPTVTIDGREAEIVFFGGAPEMVAGVFQVNVRVPAGTASGTVPVEISIGGASTQADVTMEVQ